MNTVKVFHLNNNKYYVFLEESKSYVESHIKRNLMTIKSIEEPLIENMEGLREWEKLETLLRMIKNGFDKVRGWKFVNQYLLIKDYNLIRTLIKNNNKYLQKYLQKYNINEIDWEKDLDASIKREKDRHAKTTCFICCKKGHFAVNCREDYDIDGEYIGVESKCKYCKKIIKKNNIGSHEKNCKKYYSS